MREFTGKELCLRPPGSNAPRFAWQSHSFRFNILTFAGYSRTRKEVFQGVKEYTYKIVLQQ